MTQTFLNIVNFTVHNVEQKIKLTIKTRHCETTVH